MKYGVGGYAGGGAGGDRGMFEAFIQKKEGGKGLGGGGGTEGGGTPGGSITLVKLYS